MRMARADRDLLSARERWRRRLMIWPVVALVAAVIGVFGYARLTWDAWPWQYSPSQLSACDRHFQRAELQSRAQLDADQEHLVRLGTVGHWFDRRPLWADVSDEGYPVTRMPGGCSVVLWIQESADSYRVYDLEGGP